MKNNSDDLPKIIDVPDIWPHELPNGPIKRRCEKIQHSDQVECYQCFLKWDVNDLYPPICPHARMSEKEITTNIRVLVYLLSTAVLLLVSVIIWG